MGRGEARRRSPILQRGSLPYADTLPRRLPRLVENSLIIAFISIIIALAVGVPLAYILARVLIWNEFLIAVTLTGPATKTVAVGVWTGMAENQVTYKSVNWDDLTPPEPWPSSPPSRTCWHKKIPREGFQPGHDPLRISEIGQSRFFAPSNPIALKSGTK